MARKHIKEIERHDINIRTSENDNNEAVGFELPNKMKILINSDNNASMTRVVLTVGVGSNMDPPDFQGLAHFCEHMVFLGSKKYPSFCDFYEFVHCFGRGANASTGLEKTQFYFEVFDEYLEEALDRIAQFLISPLFTEELVMSEIEVIESEFLNSEKRWEVHYIQLFRSKFQCGNKETLLENPSKKGLNLQKALREFHEKWYSSNRSSLDISTKRPPEEIENYLKTSSDIGKIPCNDKIVFATVNPWIREKFANKIQIVPPKECLELRVTFQTNSDRNSNKYVGYLLKYKGRGSLYAELKRRNWATSLEIIGNCLLTFQLTGDGFKNYVAIIKLLFNYIGMMSRSGLHKYIYDEWKKLEAIASIYKTEEESLIVVSCENKCKDFNPAKINKSIELLTPLKMMISLISKQFKGDAGNKMEFYFGTELKTTNISQSLLEEFKLALTTSNNRFHLPNSNIYEPKKFSLTQYDPCMDGKRYAKYGNKHYVRYDLLETEWIDCSYRRYKSSLQTPKAATKIVISSIAFEDNPFSKIVAILFVECLKESLEVEMFDATLAGFTYRIEFEETEMQIVIQAVGFSDKHPMSVNFIIKKLANLCPSKAKFQRVLSAIMMEIRNKKIMQPCELSKFYLNKRFGKMEMTSDEYLNIYKSVTLDDIYKMKSMLLTKFKVNMFCFGNITKTDVVQLAECVVNSLKTAKSAPFIPKKNVELHRQQLNIKPERTFISCHRQKKFTSSAVTLRFEINIEDLNINRVIADILANILNAKAHNCLRTKEHLGYIACCRRSSTLGTDSITFTVQGPRNPEYLLERIENFVQEVSKEIEGMSHSEFASWSRASLMRSESNFVENIFELDSIGFEEESEETQPSSLDINEKPVEVTKEQVVDFYKRKIMGKERRKIAILVYGKYEKPGKKEMDYNENGQKVKESS